MNNKTYRAINYPLESYANKAIVDVSFTFTLSDGSPYDFTGNAGLFLSIYDRKDGKLIKQWIDSKGLDLYGSTILWNERDATAMAFSLGKYYYELGYTIVDYSIEDQIPLIFGEMKFI
jgi:hypothetical protein